MSDPSAPSPAPFLYPPLAVVTDDDQRGALWVVSVLCLICILLTLAARAYVRWRHLQPDDWAIIFASVLATAQSAVVFAAMGTGLGASMSLVDRMTRTAAWDLFLTSEAMWALIVFLTRISVVLTFDRLLAQDMKIFRMLSKVTLGLVGALGVASLLALVIGCGAGDVSRNVAVDQCGQSTRWIIVTILDSASELWLMGLITWVICSLQMSSQKKVEALMLFGVRLGCLIFGAIHAWKISDLSTSVHRSVDSMAPLAWQQVAMAYSLISAIVIALKPFLKDFHTGMLMDRGAWTQHGSGGYGTKASQGGDTIPMKTFSQVTRTVDNEGSESQVRIRPEQIQYSAAIFHPNNERQPSLESGHSQRAMIRRDVDYQVHYEAA